MSALQTAESERLEAAFRELRPVLVRYAEGMVGSRPDAEEAVQEAFLAAAGSGPILELRPWLFRVTRNAVINLLRRRRANVSLDDTTQDAVEPVTPQRALETAEDLRLLRVCVDRLPEPKRSALMLRELGGLAYRDIAEVIDTSEANVKVLIFRARQSLHELTDAASMACCDARTSLSARADGETARAESARAALHAAHCRDCRGFAGAVRRQRVGFGLLVPPVPLLHGIALPGAAAAGAGGAAAGGGGFVGAKLAVAAATAAAVALTATGGTVAWHDGLFPPHRPMAVSAMPGLGDRAFATPVQPVAAAPAGDGSEAVAEPAETGGAEPAGDGGEPGDGTPATWQPAVAPAGEHALFTPASDTQPSSEPGDGSGAPPSGGDRPPGGDT